MSYYFMFTVQGEEQKQGERLRQRRINRRGQGLREMQTITRAGGENYQLGSIYANFDSGSYENE